MIAAIRRSRCDIRWRGPLLGTKIVEAAPYPKLLLGPGDLARGVRSAKNVAKAAPSALVGRAGWRLSKKAGFKVISERLDPPDAALVSGPNEINAR